MPRKQLKGISKNPNVIASDSEAISKSEPKWDCFGRSSLAMTLFLEALEELLSLDINAYVFYQPSITIFHPKIYLFEGADKSELIIGSSNLTSQGLFTNVETSLLVSIDNSVETDRKIVKQLKNYFKGIFDFTDPNLKKLSKKIIAGLVKAKV